MSYSDDELPELEELLKLPKPQAASRATSNALRRSPRKKTANNEDTKTISDHDVATLTAASRQTRRSPTKQSPKKLEKTGAPKSKACTSKLGTVPSLTRSTPSFPVHASSNNKSSSQHETRPVRLTHVDSLLLPLSKMAIKDQISTGSMEPTMVNEKAQAKNTYSRFVLAEARCNDDNEESTPENDEDEDTDLSGFIVDDEADLSYHEWSDAESSLIGKTSRPVIKPKLGRRLQRGSPQRSRLHSGGISEQDRKGRDEYSLATAVQDLRIDHESEHRRHASIEVIDLTQSPVMDSKDRRTARASNFDFAQNQGSSPKPDFLSRFDKALKLSPPQLLLPAKLPQKQEATDSSSNMNDISNVPQQQRFATPPATPPRSPSRLNSPSKLLSPSKRNIIPHSPHRQSTDAFWDLHTINSWNDQYSPKKTSAISPQKRGLARFQIWSDDSADEDQDNTSSSSLPSPCSSPTKSRSPMRSPEKAEKQRLAAEKKAAKARKAAFDTIKEQIAVDLLHELDVHITSSKLSRLSTSTGGVNIIWSKTLRSTAGRANWRRTVTKPTGSPIKGNAIPEGMGVKVQHFANIELAAKVIDSEDRLVNTLAHEFCHLANFMVSNVRDQPHGASFKSWAKKVTAHLQSSDNEVWRKVEVTTKHSYKIDHKYLWVCTGRERSKAAEFLNLEEDEGCGAEYGRHSRSIDTEKQRCGRCKGRLVQVRPKPRAGSPVKKGDKVLDLDLKVPEGEIVEVVELSD